MLDFLISVKDLYKNKTNRKVSFFEKNNNEDLSIYDIAILGINSSKDNKNTTNIRDEFYKLYLPENIDIIDLGNIVENEDNNIYQQIQIIYDKTIFYNLKLIVLGEYEKYNIGFFKNHSKKAEKFNLITIGSEIDFYEENNNVFDENFLNYFILNKDLLDEYYHLGYQNFLVDEKTINYFEKNNYNAFRLSEIKADFIDFEPFFRNSEIVSLDLGAIKYSDCPASKKPQPAGFDSTEICKISYFGGLSKSIKIFGIYEYSAENDINNISAKLIAQIMWYYLDAYVEMKTNTIVDQKDFSVFHIHFENRQKDIKLKFIHHEKVDLWWLSVNNGGYDKLIPCSFKDYTSAKNNLLSKRIELIVEKFGL